MLKLIASDMDGTMLDANECVPDGTYELILRLREEGVRFAATSGRRFDTLCELFEPIVDCMDFVASNGAQVIVEGELVDLEVFSHAAVKRLARVVDLFDTMHLALFDETDVYKRQFLECASAQAARAYAALERADADSGPSTQAARAAGAGRLPIEAGFAPACGKDA